MSSTIIGVSNDTQQGLTIQHDSSHNGYLGIVTLDSNHLSSCSFSITSSELETIITSSELNLQIKSLTIPSLIHDDEEDRILVVNKNGIIKTRSYPSSSSLLLWLVLFGVTLYKSTFLFGINNS